MIYPRPHPAEFAIDAPSSEIRPFEAWARGLGIAFDETNGFPELESFNGLLQAITQYIKYLEQNGFSEWSADVEYPLGAGCRVGGVWYRAKVRNTNKPPATSQTEWEVFLNAAALTYDNPLYIENNVIKIRAASQTQTGVSRFATSAEVNAKSNVSATVNPANVTTIAQSTDLGVGQTWRNVTGSRTTGATYTNNTGKPITVAISVVVGGSSSFYVNNVEVGHVNDFTGTITFIIPNGNTYRLTAVSTLRIWAELS